MPPFPDIRDHADDWEEMKDGLILSNHIQIKDLKNNFSGFKGHL